MHGSDLCLKVGVWGEGDLGRARHEESPAVGWSKQEQRTKKRDKERGKEGKDSSCMTEDAT